MKTRIAVLLAVAVAGLLAVSSQAGGLTLALPDDSSGTLTLGGVECDLIAVGAPAAAPPVGTGSCPGVRPGALVESPVGICSFNFLYAGSDGNRYMGTAGHCILEEDGERTWNAGTGPVAKNAAGARVGEFAYAVLRDEKDFALVRLDSGVPASPQMCHFGGPTYLNDSNPTSTVTLNHYGQGVAITEVLPARTAVAAGMPSDDHVFANGAAIFGDSGSGIMTSDGGAVGVIVTVGVHVASVGTSGIDAGVIGVTRLTPQLQQAGSQLGGLTFALQTAPLL